MSQKDKTKPQPTRQTLEEIEKAARLKETWQVVAQPHRRGNGGDRADALGRFVEIHQCGNECYECGNKFFRLVYRWRVAMGIPVSLRMHEGENLAGGELELGTIHEWLAKIRRCEEAMKCFGLPGYRAAKALMLNGEYPEEHVAGPVKRALLSLAIELGCFPY